jgi:hypothetical protein
MCIPTGDERLLTANFNQPEDEPPEPPATPVTTCPDGSVVAAAPSAAPTAHLRVLHAHSQRAESASGVCRWGLCGGQVGVAVQLLVVLTALFVCL